MSRPAKRRRKAPRLYDILIVSLGEGSRTRKFRASRLTMGLLVLAAFLFSVAVTLVVLMFTPVAMYVPLPSPLLEEKYGKQIAETQQQLTELAEQVLLMRDYNFQLRKALGENVQRDSSIDWTLPVSVSLESQEGESRRSTSRSLQSAFGVFPAAGESRDAARWPSPYSAGASHARFPLLVPTEGYMTQGFDPDHGHFGMDIAGKRGTPVHAASSGRVVFSGWTYEDGNTVILSHGGSVLTVYKHNQTLLASAHSTVKRGEPIALLGTSGKTSLGPHLHFEVWMDGVPHDPDEFLLRPSNR
ncbi:MAG: M23 family metallopeptidase [Bacteroidetes bacterium]|nr:M23 family metallopeptidase [Bacteroidota bacterium]